ncbi:hypothetical protein TA3x_002517 [Tundrisphaera sp. TA3]|uniref:hypothetical protein n=1 Tax=Tundrisphaera sp. TA3 TaxID=3435775 RepID=UPI003EBEFDFD
MLAAWLLASAPPSSGQDIEAEPIRYSTATPRNPIAELKGRIDAGAARLEFAGDHGYLRGLLKALDIPESSQVLVYSKTSMQRQRISPKTPRAIYFNDDVTVGYCLKGSVLEIATVDDALGTSFYTIDQDREVPPAPERQTESCLLCHASSANQKMPGHLVRSLYVDRQGEPMLAGGSFRTDHESPLAERWGGWYVTGTSGNQEHLGNRIYRGNRKPESYDDDGVNVVDLSGRFTTALYPTPHSDIVALMVLEHQVGMLNRLARAGIETRMALHYQEDLNKALGRPPGTEAESTRSRIRSVGDAVVRYMLFQGEAQLTGDIEGTSPFAAEFAARGPRDGKGRSLREFDLQTRLFRHPCSYLITSRAYTSLPAEVKGYIDGRLWDILNDRNRRKDDPRLSAEDRRAIIEILRATRTDLPEAWKDGPA